jgi:rhodanese-related sulfurtransferase
LKPEIDFRSLTIIFTTSLVVGLVFNYFNPKGIPLVRPAAKINWASDSELYINQPNSQLQTDSSVIDAKSDEPKTVKNSISDAEKNDLNKKEKEFTSLPPKAITLAQAYKLFNQKVIFIDARNRDDYDKSRVKNALSLPFYEFDGYKDILKKIPQDELIVIYCNGPECDLSDMLAEELYKIGYGNILIFKGGWEEWEKAGYPYE